MTGSELLEMGSQTTRYLSKAAVLCTTRCLSKLAYDLGMPCLRVRFMSASKE